MSPGLAPRPREHRTPGVANDARGVRFVRRTLAFRSSDEFRSARGSLLVHPGTKEINLSSNETSVAKVRSRDGTTIAFDRTGDGPPLIFVGGAFQQRSGQGMAQLAALLAPRLTVYNHDRRGRGDSGDTPPYAVEREIEDLEALIAEAGGSAHLYGISSGGALALEAAAGGIGIDRLAVYEV